MSCSHCKSADIRRSCRKGLGGLLMSALGRWPYRCRSCRGHFFADARAMKPRICPLPALQREHLAVYYWLGAMGAR